MTGYKEGHSLLLSSWTDTGDTLEVVDKGSNDKLGRKEYQNI